MIQAAQAAQHHAIVGVLRTKRWRLFRKCSGSVNLKFDVVATVRIIIVDDHALIRSGLRTLLGHEPSFQLVAEGKSSTSTNVSDLFLYAIRKGIVSPQLDPSPRVG